MPRQRGSLRRRVRRRDKWTCKLCHKVSCTKGKVCNRNPATYSEDFKLWKRNICDDGKKCQIVVHHVKPIREGRNHSSDNAILLCRKCNRKVHNEIDNYKKAEDAPITRTLMNIINTNNTHQERKGDEDETI